MKPRKAIPRVSKARRARSGVPGKCGIVRLYGKDMETLRRLVFERDGYQCQWKDCGAVVGWDGPRAGHLAHIKSRGAGGSDTLENTRCLCFIHHIISEHTLGEKG